MPEVLILTGPPGAGKSTAAQALAERYDRVAHIGVDEIRHMITPTGYVRPGRPGFERQRDLATRNACALARNFLAERIAAIIDDVVVDRGDLDLYIEGLLDTTVNLHYVRLLPGLEVCLQRNLGRPEIRLAPEVETIYKAFEAAGAFAGATIDNSELTPYETADRLQALTTSGESLITASGTS